MKGYFHGEALMGGKMEDAEEALPELEPHLLA